MSSRHRRIYSYAGVQTVPWGSCGHKAPSCGRQMAQTEDSSAPPPEVERRRFVAPPTQRLPETPDDYPPTDMVYPVCDPTYNYPGTQNPCYMQHGQMVYYCPPDDRCSSPMPYPDYSYRGIRGRTFGCTGYKCERCGREYGQDPKETIELEEIVTTARRTAVPAHTRKRKKWKRHGRTFRQTACRTNADCERITQDTTIPHLCVDGECMQIRGAHRGVRQGI